MTKISVGLKFSGSGYIGKPYWPEMDTVIKVEREVHPKLGPAKKEAALNASIEKHGLTPEEFKEIKGRSERPFYTLTGGRDAEIMIPQRVFQSFLNHTSQQAPKAVPKIAEKGLTFIGVRLPDGFRTGKTEKDAKKFERLVKMAESNMRSLSSDLYIDDFVAEAIIEVDEEIISSADLRKLVEYGGKWYGLGSSRPQGYGRFQVVRWDVL